MTRDLTTLAVALVAAHKGLIGAHEAAAEFHAAMARALEYQSNMEEFPLGDPDRAHAVKHYPFELGRAAAALQKMPVKWQAVLTIDIKGD